MVKLFVGNLAESVDSHRLKNLFLQHVNVQECDVLKNFAFVHVATEDDATEVIDKLDKTMLEGREIHIERSTSRLRKEPGMSDKCFTCGAVDHKTPQCPQEQGRRKNTTKRAGDENDGVASIAKRPNTNSSFPTPVAATAAAGGGSGGSCWGYKLPTIVDADAELPCPANPELKTLYEQYKESRSRYHYFREKFQKELSLQPPANSMVAPGGSVTRIDLTRTVQPPIQISSYSTPNNAIAAAVAQSSYPGAQQTPAYASAQQQQQSYRPPSNYPGATPTAAPGGGATTTATYPGAQASTVYNAQQSAYGASAPQHYATVNKKEPVTSTYQRPQNYSTPSSYGSR